MNAWMHVFLSRWQPCRDVLVSHDNDSAVEADPVVLSDLQPQSGIPMHPARLTLVTAAIGLTHSASAQADEAILVRGATHSYGRRGADPERGGALAWR